MLGPARAEVARSGVELVEPLEWLDWQSFERELESADLIAEVDQPLQARHLLARLGSAGAVLLRHRAGGDAVGGESAIVLAPRGGELVNGEVLVVADEHPSCCAGDDH